MAKSVKHPHPLPHRDEIIRFIEEGSGKIGKREISRAFGLGARQRVGLKKMLRELKAEGLIESGQGRRLTVPGKLPNVTMVEITGTDADGDLLARPLKWEGDKTPPLIYMESEKAGREALAKGDHVLVRIGRLDDGSYRGSTIRRIASGPSRVLGIFSIVNGEGRIKPVSRKCRDEFIVAAGEAMGAGPGDMVRAEVLQGRRFGLRKVKIVERMEKSDGAGLFSMIAINEHDIPVDFSPAAVAKADAATAAPDTGREDLRDRPLVTIDGADARDFDDAVFAEADDNPDNQGGWKLIVAIADVSWYVRQDDALDVCAYERGNSVYFPDRVVPMLPEQLSNGWCSLKPGEDRPCLAAHMRINRDGHLLDYRFRRAVMRSAARLTYTMVQASMDGDVDETTAPLMENAIRPLYGAYGSLAKARHNRGALELELAERKIILDENGKVAGVDMRQRLDSHKLVEEFMITANIAAAETLSKRKAPCMFRVHNEPSMEKMEALVQFLDSINIRWARGDKITPQRFNRILDRAKGSPHSHMINMVVLRSQSKAEYSPSNIGHFGLGLNKYAHFTSPIRRYADLLVHRALIECCRLGEGVMDGDGKDFAKIGEHLSVTERRAEAAERSAVDRFTAAYLSERVGHVFNGTVNGVTRFGLFVTLDNSCADGLVPVRTMADDYYIYDESAHTLRGRSHGKQYRLGDTVEVMIMEADPISGSVVMHLTDMAGCGKERKLARKVKHGRKSRRRGRTAKK